MFLATRLPRISTTFLFLFIMIVLTQPALSYAQRADLITAYELTMKYNAKWAAQQARIAAQQTVTSTARAQLLPQAGLELQWARIDYSGQSVNFNLDADRLERCAQGLADPASLNIGTAFDRVECLFRSEVEPFSSTRLGISFTQPLFRLDRWHQYQRAKSIREQGNLELEKGRQDMLMELATTYFNVLKAKEALLVLQNEQEALAYSLKLTEQRFDRGLTKNAQVYDAKARFDNGLIQLMRSENAVQQALALLASLTQTPNIDTTELPGTITLQLPKPADPEAWVSMAYGHNPELNIANLAQRSAKANAAEKKSAHLPTLDFVASISTTDAGGATPAFDAGANTNTTLGINLQVPIFSGGAISAAKRQASHQYNAARWESANIKQNLAYQIRSQFEAILLSVKQGQAQTRSTQSSERAYRAIESGYKAGSNTLSELLQAQRAVYLAQRDAAETSYNYVLSVLKLKRIAGILNTEDLRVLNLWLNPRGQTNPNQ